MSGRDCEHGAITRRGDTELAARAKSYELAYRMEKSAPEAVDLSKETAATRELTWDARNDAGVRVKAGLYIFRVTTAGRSEILRLVVLR